MIRIDELARGILIDDQLVRNDRLANLMDGTERANTRERQWWSIWLVCGNVLKSNVVALQRQGEWT